MQRNTSERYAYLNRQDAVVWGIDKRRYCEKQIRVVGFTKSFHGRDLVPSSRILVSITDMRHWLALSVRAVAADLKARRTALGECCSQMPATLAAMYIETNR